MNVWPNCLQNAIELLAFAGHDKLTHAATGAA